MTALIDAMRELVIANRILAHEGVLDAYGHVTVRHPDDPTKFLMARSRSPELVTLGDIVTFTLDCKPIDDLGRPLYSERPIHGAIYEARPEVNAVVHNHAYDVVTFSTTKIPLRPIAHGAGGIGHEVPVWDIADRFGDKTNLLVVTMEQGRDLSKKLGNHEAVLMRGHGCAVAGLNIKHAVILSYYLQLNARLLMSALMLAGGQQGITYLAPNEIETRLYDERNPKFRDRAWEYWTRRAGCDDL